MNVLQSGAGEKIICPMCGKLHKDDLQEEGTEPCKDCNGKHIVTIQCTIDCGPGGITKREGTIVLDQITKIMLSRGLIPMDIGFLQQYQWKEIPMKEDIKRLQAAGILKEIK